MRIICRKCSAVYEIDPALIPPQGKKVRCTKCGDVFVCFPEDLQEKPQPVVREPEPEKAGAPKENLAAEVDAPAGETGRKGEGEAAAAAPAPQPPQKKDEVQDIFRRLSEQTEELFQQEQKMSKAKVAGLKLKHVLGLQNKAFRRFVLSLVLITLLLLLYYFRYDITRKAPFMEKIYAPLGIQSVIPGEGLEFQNITRREFEDDYVSKTEIKGFIANTTGKAINVPDIRLELLDKEARSLHVQYAEPPVARLDGNGKAAFSIVVVKPSPLSKYVYLTFKNEK